VTPVEPRVAVSASSLSRSVIVQRGDSLWKLAQQNLGGGLRWHELLAANPSVVDPHRLAVGTKLVVPAVSVSKPTALKIIVRQGDTLWALAQTHLGRATSWTCIAQANPMVQDPQRIFVGQELLLPASCTP
jgi:nucleoid-associated protein YgaU